MTDNLAYVTTIDDESSLHQRRSSRNSNVYENADMQIDYANLKPYAGMPKEVLLRYSRQKKFVYARNILSICVFVAILLLLSLIIAFIAISPACQLFWKTSPIYEIYTKSYQDSDADGNGDIKGIINRLSYLSDDLGIKTLVLKDVIDGKDYESVNPLVGTRDNLVDLITRAHENGMYVIIEIVPNHTSEDHPWFVASCDPSSSNYTKYKDFYLWETTADASIPPNNWQIKSSSDTPASAWTYHSERNQFYYHAIDETKPDLNFRSESVRHEFEEILRYWMELNMDGFRFSFINYIFESEHMRDQQLIDSLKPVSYSNMYQDFTKDVPGIHDLLMEWRHLLDEYSTEPGVYRVMEVDTEIDESSEKATRYYGNEYTSEADLPINYNLVSLETGSEWTGTRIGSQIIDWMENMPTKKWPNWRLGTSESLRLMSRVDNDVTIARCVAMITTTLSGSCGIYYGDEIGMTSDPTKDTPQQTPMQWDTTNNGGFTDSETTWLEVNDDYITGINVQEQLEDEDSLLNLYKSLISLRSDVVFLRGYFCLIMATDDLLVYVRELEGVSSVLIAINFSDDEEQVGLQITNEAPNLFPENGEVIQRTSSRVPLTGTISLPNFRLLGKTGVVVEFKPTQQVKAYKDKDFSCYVSTPVRQNAIGILQKS